MASSENRLIVCVLFLYLIVTITCQMDCLTAWEECVKDDSCSMVLNYFKVHCNNSVPACQLTDPTGCQAVATAIAAQPLFQSCYCDSHTLEFAECNHLFRMLFDDSCIDNTVTSTHDVSTSTEHVSYTPSGTKLSGQVTPFTKSNTDGTLTPISNAYDDVVNCNTAKTLCLENDYCKAVYTYYMNSCPFRKNVCLAESSIGDTCMDARGHLNTTVLGRCRCYPGMHGSKKCQRLLKRIHENPCLDGELEDETLTYISEPDVTTIGIDPIAVGPTGGYNGGESTCDHALFECNSDTICRNTLANYIQKCSPLVDDTCKTDECLVAKSSFFESSRHILTHSLVFCHCKEGDDVCTALHNGLNPVCSHMETPTPDCLDLIVRCTDDAKCGSKYQQFLQQCTPDRSSPSGCSGSLGKCRTAYVGILSTVIARICNCISGLPECSDFQKLLFHNQCVSTAAQAFYSSDIASTVKATTLEHKVVTDGEFEDETYSSEPDVTTMGIDSIAVGPTGGYNGRVADCQVSLFNGEAVISVPPDNDVRIPLKVTGCSTVCRCSRYGSLVNCDQLICVNVSAYCIYNGKSYAHNEVFRDPLHGNCVCFEGTVICSITEHSNFGLCLTHNGVPCINIGYSLQEEKMMSDYVHETFLGSTVQQKLQFLIDTIHVNGTRNKSCKLKLNGHEPGVLMLSVNGETASNETDAVCRETLIRLSDLINTRAPCIITDILLSVLKVSTASGQPMGSAMPAKSCSSALQYAEQRKNGLGKNSRSNYSGICPY